MQASSYDILRRDAFGHAVRIESVPDVESAKSRVLHLAERFPADYLIFHQATARVVANFHFKPNDFDFSATHVAEESLSRS
jgi:hypothetical protein